MQVVIFEAILLGDVLEHPTLMQPDPVEQRLSSVLWQTHLQQPLYQLTAKKSVRHCPLPTPVCQRKDSPTGQLGTPHSWQVQVEWEREREGADKKKVFFLKKAFRKYSHTPFHILLY